MTKFRTPADIFALWETAEDMAAALGERSGTVRMWRHRNAIPLRHFPKVVEAARARGVNITLQDLYGLGRGPGNREAA